MSKLLSELTELINSTNIANIKQPNTSLGKDDHVAGIMSEDLRLMYGVWDSKREELVSLVKKLQHILIDHQGEPKPPQEFLDSQAKLALLNSKVEALEALFWNSVRHEFPSIADKYSIGVRWGWKVVWKDDDRQHSGDFLAILKKLLG